MYSDFVVYVITVSHVFISMMIIIFYLMRCEIYDRLCDHVMFTFFLFFILYCLLFISFSWQSSHIDGMLQQRTIQLYEHQRCRVVIILSYTYAYQTHMFISVVTHWWIWRVRRTVLILIDLRLHTCVCVYQFKSPSTLMTLALNECIILNLFDIYLTSIIWFIIIKQKYFSKLWHSL
jgi:hypothetical protein